MSQNQQLEGEISASGPLAAGLESIDTGTHVGQVVMGNNANPSASADPPSEWIPIISNNTTETMLPPVVDTVPNTPEPLFSQCVMCQNMTNPQQAN